VMRAQHIEAPDYAALSLPLTEKINGEMLKCPSFPLASTDLLDQYVLAFEKGIEHASAIRRYCA